MLKYNYVVFGSPNDYYEYSYGDIIKHPDRAVYLSKVKFNSNSNAFLRLLFKVHTSYKVNRFVNLPFKSLWNKKIFNYKFQNNKQICFIFFSSGEFTNQIPYGFIECLKSIYENSKFVVFYQDLIGSCKRVVSLDDFKEKMDLVMSFDYSDCNKYGLIYYPLVYSDKGNDIKQGENSDIYFCGAAKNRFDTIVESYNFFVERGYSCKYFVITNNKSEISRCKNFKDFHTLGSLSYIDNLRYVKGCKAILEIMQEGGTGHTLRINEAIAFNKKLITNNQYIVHSSAYNPKDVLVFKDVKDIDIKDDFFESKCTMNMYLNDILVDRFFSFIEEHI